MKRFLKYLKCTAQILLNFSMTIASQVIAYYVIDFMNTTLLS